MHYFIFMLFYIMHGGQRICQPCERKISSQTALLRLVSHIDKILVGPWNTIYSQTSARFPSDQSGLLRYGMKWNDWVL